MQRLGEQDGRGAGLHDAAGVHDGHLSRQFADHGQVVADVDGSNPVALAQTPHSVKDVTLGGHVKAGGGLVQHDERGPAGKGHGEPDALLLATR
jgi:hypothetical protein